MLSTSQRLAGKSFSDMTYLVSSETLDLNSINQSINQSVNCCYTDEPDRLHAICVLVVAVCVCVCVCLFLCSLLLCVLIYIVFR